GHAGRTNLLVADVAHALLIARAGPLQGDPWGAAAARRIAEERGQALQAGRARAARIVSRLAMAGRIAPKVVRANHVLVHGGIIARLRSQAWLAELTRRIDRAHRIGSRRRGADELAAHGPLVRHRAILVGLAGAAD